MANTFRVATFNAENLFRRAKALDLKHSQQTNAIMAQVKSLAAQLAKPIYTTTGKETIWKISAEPKKHITIRKELGTFDQLIKYGATGKAGY